MSRDPVLKKWALAIPRADKALTHNYGVCEIHFMEECIERFFERILPDGTISKIERERPVLKTGSILTIFPNLPSYFTKNIKKRKALNEKLAPIKRKNNGQEKCTQPNIIPNHTPIVPFSFEQLKKLSSGDLKKPDGQWKYGVFETEIVFERCQLNSKRKIVIFENLTLKIFCNDIEVLVDKQYYNVNSLDGCNQLIAMVHALILCKGIMSLTNNTTR
ncbi:uncharacterized protein LOC126845411 [Adelges cooleyi]|uniref:uncharacterized protein LOC126845411 n=1 Tax=Adelges cooleyi TaxID=133065 RepID=UPI0021803F01|nr:uncharacterized protein LOC126845411 [Adelges cooleyi]